MAISKKIELALNKQLNEELFSSYLYLSMSANFESQGFKGFASWMRLQVEEEDLHSRKIYDFLLQRGGKVVLDLIKKPKTEWNTPLETFKAALTHEMFITKRINSLVELAQKENDHATQSFLKWFVDEQVEEEANAEEIVQKLIMSKNVPGALFMIDQELAKRQPIQE